jgi:hypothetical protein
VRVLVLRYETNGCNTLVLVQMFTLTSRKNCSLNLGLGMDCWLLPSVLWPIRDRSCLTYITRFFIIRGLHGKKVVVGGGCYVVVRIRYQE